MEPLDIEKLLSGYLDGELDDAERRIVEQELRQPRSTAVVKLQQLRQLSRALVQLPQLTAPTTVIPSVLSRIKAGAGGTNGASSLPDLLENADEFLTAYADGELTAEQRRDVEDYLLIWEDHRKSLAQIQSVRAWMGELPEVSLSRDQSQNLLRGLAGDDTPTEANSEFEEFDDSDAATERPNKRPFRELLSAYLDGEVDDKRRHRVENRLRSSPKVRDTLKRYAQIRGCLRELPRVRAPEGCLEAVLTQLRESQPEPQPVPQLSAPTPAEPATAPLPVIADSGSFDLSNLPPRREFARHDRYANIRRSFYAAIALSLALFAGFVDIEKLFLPDQRMAIVSGPTETAESNPLLPIPTAATKVIAKTEPIEATPKVVVAKDEPAPIPQAIKDMVKAEAPKVAVVRAEELPIDRLLSLRRGEILTLEHPRIDLVCVDVEQTYQSLRIILMQEGFAVRFDEERTDEKSPSMYRLEISTTPDKLDTILTALGQHERTAAEQSIAQADVTSGEAVGGTDVPPEPPALAKDREARVKVQPAPLANVTPNDGKEAKSEPKPRSSNSANKKADRKAEANAADKPAKPETPKAPARMTVVFVLKPVAPAESSPAEKKS